VRARTWVRSRRPTCVPRRTSSGKGSSGAVCRSALSRRRCPGGGPRVDAGAARPRVPPAAPRRGSRSDCALEIGAGRPRCTPRPALVRRVTASGLAPAHCPQARAFTTNTAPFTWPPSAFARDRGERLVGALEECPASRCRSHEPRRFIWPYNHSPFRVELAECPQLPTCGTRLELAISTARSPARRCLKTPTGPPRRNQQASFSVVPRAS